MVIGQGRDEGLGREEERCARDKLLPVPVPRDIRIRITTTMNKCNTG